jgi:hypothetical protein
VFLIGREQFESPPLMQCWPFNPDGPLPELLADRRLIGDTFFLHLPAHRKWPASAVRRGLKQVAKQLGIPFDRSNTGFDQRERDDALAYQFATRPDGREALPGVEIYVDDIRGNRRKGKWVPRIGRRLSEILWIRYLVSSQFGDLVSWATTAGIVRTDLGDPDAFFLTSDSLDAALRAAAPPVPLDDPELARVILLFAALLPFDEAVCLVQTASKHGMTALEPLVSPLAEKGSDVTDQPPDATLSLASAPTTALAKSLPVLAPVPQLAINTAPLPQLSAAAKDLTLSASAAFDAAGAAELEIDPGGSVMQLLELDEIDYVERRQAIERAREARARRQAVTSKCRGFVRITLLDAMAMSGLEPPQWIHDVDRATPENLALMVSSADAIASFAKPGIDTRIGRTWAELASGSRDLLTLLEAFRKLPSLRSHVEALASRESEFIAAIRAFVESHGNGTTDIAAWLRRASLEEIRTLLDNIDARQWPVAAALLIRLGLDGGAGFAADCERRLTAAEDSQVRRDMLHLVDPTSILFDGYPALQRMIAAERLRDALSFGPLVVVTDPSLRLSDEMLVGAPLAALTNLLIHHLDIIGNGVELRRLAAPHGASSGSNNNIGAELATYATTTSASSGFYLQLREAIRERHFAPLVKQGQVNPKAAAVLASSFDVEDAIELAVADVRRENARAARIEPRHRARIQRYVRQGKELLDTFLQSTAPQAKSRQRVFGAEFASALAQLSKESSVAGSQEWLEFEVRSMLLGPAPSFEFPTLRGCPTPISECAWTASETAWAQQSMDLAEFYLQGSVQTVDVAASAIRHWALGRNASPQELADDLLARGQIAAARAYAEEAAVPASERQRLSGHVANAAGEALAPLKQRLEALEVEHGSTLVRSISTTAEVQESLERWELREAAEQLDFLEMEVSELIEHSRPDALHATITTERTTLLRRLLKAGVEGPDERWSLADLEGRWSAELLNRAGERIHLRTIEKMLEATGALPELAGYAQEFSQRMLDPVYWIPEQRSSELDGFVDTPAEKLRTWIQLSGQLNEAQRRALIATVRWYVRFVEEEAAAIGSLDEGASSDMLLERVLDVGGVIEQSPDPVSCAQGLGLADGTLEAPPPRAAARTPATEAISAKLVPLAEQADWPSLAQAARTLRLDTGDEDSRRMVDIAEFADTVVALSQEQFESARDGLVTSAKVLGASGYFINRALPISRLLAIAFDLLAAAIVLSNKTGLSPPVLHQDGSWTPLLEKRVGLAQVLAGNSLAARTLEQLCSGTIGREVINRLWDAPTATAEPGPIRGALLSFLHERSLNEHLLLLAARHEPAIRSRLEQLLNLRAIVSQRPDLVPVSEAVANQVAKAAQGVPFRTFVASLPTVAQAIDADLVVSVDNDIVLRIDKRRRAELSVAISIEPRGLVPESMEAILFPNDDVSFDDGSRRRRLSDQAVYFASQWTVGVRFGESWHDTSRQHDDNFRIRINARVLAGELISRDVVCQLARVEVRAGDAKRIDDETLLEAFPGVENTPAAGESFIGRHDELERLHGALVGARRPSPVLLTGMRRIGKTSLLYAFHGLHRQPRRDAPITVYFSLAERRAAMMDPTLQVSAVFYSAIAQALGKRNFSSTDLNGELGEKLRQRLGSERDAVRNAILELRDSESLADSLTILSERLLDWAGGATRVIYLVDEAETLVLPYRGGEAKRLELEQLLQGLREISQTSTKVGLLLSGSNHIAEFARSYKNAFFGSSLQIDLAGMTNPETAQKLVSPAKLAPYVSFAGEPVRYAIEMCAGMPQFLWQLGAATTAIVRSGPVTKADVRQGVSALVGGRSIDLPFKAYEVLEPIEHMLGLQGQREQDLLWLLLWRVANSSSLVVDEAQQSYIIDQSLLELDELEAWKSRLLSLVDLDILEMPRSSMYRFRVPIFAEGFRAPRQQHAYELRRQRAGT